MIWLLLSKHISTGLFGDLDSPTATEVNDGQPSDLD